MRWLRLLGAYGAQRGRSEGEATMPVRGVNTIKHHVNDWPAAIAFYRDTLGLRLAFAQDGVWASFETPDGGRIGLVMEREGVRRAPHVVVKVDGLDQLVAQIGAAGAEIIEASVATEYGRVAVVRDPAGNMIELVE
jgi:predicted enzyme related to lactoylglutathione lyase